MDYPFEKEKVKAFAYSLENLDLSSEGNYVISTGRQIPGGTKSFQATLASSQGPLYKWTEHSQSFIF